MATFISLHIRSTDTDKVVHLLQQLSGINNFSKGPYPKDLDDNTLMGEHSTPTYMAICEPRNGWINVYLNSFAKLHSWIEVLSKELATTVIHIIGQTVSDVYYFLVYENGTLRREIEIYYDEIENAIDAGEKFAFEKHPIIPPGDEYENIFDREMIENYCNEFGFKPYDEYDISTYHIIRGKNTGITIKEAVKAYTQKKPWWKFW